MRIAISASGQDLDSQIDPRFGRCAYFLIVETDDMSFEAFNNDNIALGGGAGIQSAQFVASKGVKAVLTGNCGPNAVQTLSAAGVELFVGQSGRVKDAVEKYKSGNLRPVTEANVSDHYGMGGGRGMGRGMGMGGGRGMGRGMGTPGGNVPDRVASGDLPRNQELNFLKEQAGGLMKQMEEIQNRIKKLEK